MADERKRIAVADDLIIDWKLVRMRQR